MSGVSSGNFPLQEIRNGYTDVHLAAFNLDSHRSWMDQLVTQTVVLANYKYQYARYTEEWLSRNATPRLPAR
jgi:hypothetical protein